MKASYVKAAFYNLTTFVICAGIGAAIMEPSRWKKKIGWIEKEFKWGKVNKQAKMLKKTKKVAFKQLL